MLWRWRCRVRQAFFGKSTQTDWLPENYVGTTIDSRPQVPVDLVYTWADGLSETLTEQRREWAIRLGVPLDDANRPHRYSNNGELKLSLRTVEKFLPWVRKIFIVASGPAPEWLDTSDSRIELVPDVGIFPDKSFLPTFNSHAVEFQLNRIPGLSEHFIYCNDDMLFGAPCSKDDFFTFSPSGEGIPNYQFSGVLLPDCLCVENRRLSERHKMHWQTAWSNLRELLEKDYPPLKVRSHFIHQATPLRKSTFEYAAKKYSHYYEEVSASRFRSLKDIPPIGLVSYLGLIRKEAVLKPTSEHYMSTLNTFREYLKSGRRAKLLCVNSMMENKDVCDAVSDLGFFVEPSCFEKASRKTHRNYSGLVDRSKSSTCELL